MSECIRSEGAIYAMVLFWIDNAVCLDKWHPKQSKFFFERLNIASHKCFNLVTEISPSLEEMVLANEEADMEGVVPHDTIFEIYDLSQYASLKIVLNNTIARREWDMETGHSQSSNR